ncbi:hypothetical protein [Cupriavidus sp. 8B]
MQTKDKKLLSIVAAVAGVAVLVVTANYFTLARPLSSAMSIDGRNEGISVRVHYQYLVNPSEIEFDLREVRGDKSAADVTRVLLQFAAAVKDRSFKTIRLAHGGVEKFELDGAYFHTLGVEFGEQNPIYTIRTMPEHVVNLDGSPAFGTWTGGWLGVVSKQMEDVHKFHRRWYIDDLAQGGGSSR